MLDDARPKLSNITKSGSY